MMKFLGWLLVSFVVFCIFGFFMDWVEMTKQNVPGQSTFSIVVNHGKMVGDVGWVCKTVSVWVKQIGH